LNRKHGYYYRIYPQKLGGSILRNVTNSHSSFRGSVLRNRGVSEIRTGGSVRSEYAFFKWECTLF